MNRNYKQHPLDKSASWAIVAVFAILGILFAICPACKQQPLQQDNMVVKAQIRVVGIDSTTNARSEDKVLFVTVK